MDPLRKELADRIEFYKQVSEKHPSPEGVTVYFLIIEDLKDLLVDTAEDLLIEMKCRKSDCINLANGNCPKLITGQVELDYKNDRLVCRTYEQPEYNEEVSATGL